MEHTFIHTLYCHGHFGEAYLCITSSVPGSTAKQPKVPSRPKGVKISVTHKHLHIHTTLVHSTECAYRFYFLVGSLSHSLSTTASVNFIKTHQLQFNCSAVSHFIETFLSSPTTISDSLFILVLALGGTLLPWAL